MKKGSMKVYLAGKMTGNPGYKEEFDAACAALREKGHNVMNPAILPEGWDYEAYLNITFAMLHECDAVCLLPNWIDSRGARREVLRALSEEIGIISYAELTETGKARVIEEKEVLQMLATNSIAVKPGKRTPEHRFVRPTVEEVAAYCAEQGYDIDAMRFVDFYAAKGWKIGREPMKDWRAAVRTWAGRKKEEANAKRPRLAKAHNHNQRAYTEADFAKIGIDLLAE